MRIEIFANGGGAVGQFQSGLRSLRGDISQTITSFRQTRQKIQNLPGGAANLSGSVSQIETRIRAEEQRGEKVDALLRQSETFLTNTAETDTRVAKMVHQNQEKFFQKYTRLAPAENGWQSWWEQRVKDWNKFWDDAGKWMKKVWDGIVDFVKEHWVELVIGTVAIVVGAVIVALTAGTAGVFLGALLAGLKAAAISAATSAAISAGVALITGDDPLKAAGDGLASGYMFGGIFAGLSLGMSGLFRYLGGKGVTGVTKGNFKFLDPNKRLDKPISGGTLIKSLTDPTKHLDVDVHFNIISHSNLLHGHISTAAFQAMKLYPVLKHMTWIFAPVGRTVHIKLIPVLAPIVANLMPKRQ